jgi:hypothetical protein
VPPKYERNIAGENYVTRARSGPVGRDLARRTHLVKLDSWRRVPVGQGRARDEWAPGYAGGGLKRSIHSEVKTRGGNLVGVITADAVRPDTIDGSSYAASVHEGSAPHEIFPKRKRWLRYPSGQGFDVFPQDAAGNPRGVRHPGRRKGIPYLRDALEAARG